MNFILPSGSSVSFETNQTFRDRYMEAFVSGGEYQWQAIAQDANGNEICVSEVATFEKPAYQQPRSSIGGDRNGDSGSSDDGPGGGGSGCQEGDPNCP